MSQLVEKLNSVELDNCDGFPVNDETILEGLELVELADNLDINAYRHYETKVKVYQIGGEILGVRVIGNIYSEECDASDIGYKPSWKVMTPVSVITYI